MSGIVEERSLRLEGPFQPVEHAVEGFGKLGALVATGDRDALREVRVGDLARRRRRVTYWAQDALRDEPGEERPYQQDRQPDAADGSERSVELPPGEVAEIRCDEDPPRLSTAPQRYCEVLDPPDRTLVGAAVGGPQVAPPLDECFVLMEQVVDDGATSLVGHPVDEGQQSLVTRRDVPLEVDIEDALDVAGERTRGLGIDAARQLAQLVDLLDQLGVDPGIELCDEQLACNEHRGERCHGEQADVSQQDPRADPCEEQGCPRRGHLPHRPPQVHVPVPRPPARLSQGVAWSGAPRPARAWRTREAG